MFNRIRSIFASPTTSTIVRVGMNAVQSNSKQPMLAPMALGGSVIAGLVSVLIGGYKIVDCIRYQTAPGQCDSTIEENVTVLIAGSAAISGSWGGFNTYNHNLRGEEQPALAQIAPKELVVKNPVLVEPSDVLALKEQGLSQREISEVLGISRYAVKKAINLFTNESIS
jgi:hypothetical protein